MISCRDVNNLQMDGMELVAGAAGLDRIVSWTYLVQTKPYKDHMNPGNFGAACGRLQEIFHGRSI